MYHRCEQIKCSNNICTPFFIFATSTYLYFLLLQAMWMLFTIYGSSVTNFYGIQWKSYLQWLRMWRWIKQNHPSCMKSITSVATLLVFGTRGPLKIINPVIDALNDNNHLPRIILIIPDWDLLKGNMKSAFVMGFSLHYIIKQLDLVIERRHEDLLYKHKEP